MGRRMKQPLYKKRYPKSQYTYKSAQHNHSLKKMYIKTMKYHYIPTGMTKIKKNMITENNGKNAKQVQFSMHCLARYKMKPFCKTVWHFLINRGMRMT